MEDENEVVVEGTENEEVVNDVPAVVDEGEAGKVVETPVYTPNFKYKVMDDEKEFDEAIKSVIKSKEDEDKIRDLYTKAGGLDAVNTKYSKLQESHTNYLSHYQEEVEPYVQNVERVKSLVAAPNFEGRDYQTFFQELGIPNEHILKYTKSILDYQDATPEQRAQIDYQRNLVAQNRALEEQSQFAQSQGQQLQVQARTFELNQELTKPEVSSFVTEFDKLHGPGSFRNQVIATGTNIFATRKTDVPAGALVAHVMEQFKGIRSIQPQVVATNTQETQIVKPQGPTKKPIIPNVQGNGGSPAKKVFTSLDEIKAHRKTLKNL